MIEVWKDNESIDTVITKIETELFVHPCDIDYVDPYSDLTDFMEYCMRPCPDGADQIIETREMLRKKKGTDLKRRNLDGKTARDFAVHPDSIHYLDTLR